MCVCAFMPRVMNDCTCSTPLVLLYTFSLLLILPLYMIWILLFPCSKVPLPLFTPTKPVHYHKWEDPLPLHVSSYHLLVKRASTFRSILAPLRHLEYMYVKKRSFISQYVLFKHEQDERYEPIDEH